MIGASDSEECLILSLLCLGASNPVKIGGVPGSL